MMMAPRGLNPDDLERWGLPEADGMCVCGSKGLRLNKAGESLKLGGPYTGDHTICSACHEVAVRPTLIPDRILIHEVDWRFFCAAWFDLCEALLLPLEPWSARRCAHCNHAGADAVRGVIDRSLRCSVRAFALLCLCRLLPVDAEINRAEPCFDSLLSTVTADPTELRAALERTPRLESFWQNFKESLCVKVAQQRFRPREILLSPCDVCTTSYDRLGCAPLKFGVCQVCLNRESVDMYGNDICAPKWMRWCSQCFTRVGPPVDPELVLALGPKSTVENDALRLAAALFDASCAPLWWHSLTPGATGFAALAQHTLEGIGTNFVDWLQDQQYDALAMVLSDYIEVGFMLGERGLYLVDPAIDMVRAALAMLQTREQRPVDFDFGAFIADPFAGLGSLCDGCGGMVGKLSFADLVDAKIVQCGACGSKKCSRCARFGPTLSMMVSGNYEVTLVTDCVCHVSTGAGCSETLSEGLKELQRLL